MSSSAPPLFNFTNINFNSYFFNYVDNTINQSYADGRYLIKSGDISTGVQTFSSGIKSNILNAINASDNMTIGTNATFGTLTIGSLNPSSQIIINKPLVINYSLSAYVNPSQIGYYVANSSGLISMTSGVYYASSFGVIGAGLYLINYSLELTISTASITASDTFYGVSTSTAKSGAVQSCYNYLHINTMVYNVADNPVFSGSGVYQASTSGTLFLLGEITFTGTGTIQGNLIYKWVRIG